MKKFVLAALAATAMAAIATPSMAQTTGAITINGSVGDKCLITNSTGTPSTFAGVVNLGELSAANGTMRTDLATSFNGAGAANLSFRVVCTTAAPAVTVDADPIVAQTVTGAQPAGYSNTINYQADVVFGQAAGGSVTKSNDTTASATGPVAIGRLAAAAGGTNVSVTATNFRTQSAGNTDLLVADSSYKGNITITVAPSL